MDSADFKKILVLCKCVRTVHLDQEKAGNILRISQKNGDIFKSLYSGYQKLACTCSFIEKN
jgi:hypothetical protein